MTVQLSLPWQRGLAVLPLAVALGIGWLVIVAPFVEVLDPDRSERERLERQWAAYDAAARSRPALEAELRLLRSREAEIDGLLKGSTAALTAAALQSDVKAIVEKNGGEIRSARILPASTTDTFEKVTVQYDVVVPMKALKGLMYQIETHSPHLFVDTIDIRAPENWRPSTGSTPEPKLAVRWQVSGYRWVGGR